MIDDIQQTKMSFRVLTKFSHSLSMYQVWKRGSFRPDCSGGGSELCARRLSSMVLQGKGKSYVSCVLKVALQDRGKTCVSCELPTVLQDKGKNRCNTLDSTELCCSQGRSTCVCRARLLRRSYRGK